MQMLFTNFLVSCLGVVLYGMYGGNAYARPYYGNEDMAYAEPLSEPGTCVNQVHFQSHDFQ
ncbi:hypothetical protein CSKR_113876 [Clonorchis sinensis]|uniref:Uncharacterized protein n=1 Tax=Clonorchis sinensis TaxID=79923 RepID=A0A419PV45_CLOSI|nr:hypothetical protein CSKR_113876 [Clonorchis sinensis]